MKKILVLIIGLISVFSLSACGKKGMKIDDAFDLYLWMNENYVSHYYYTIDEKRTGYSMMTFKYECWSEDDIGLCVGINSMTSQVKYYSSYENGSVYIYEYDFQGNYWRRFKRPSTDYGESSGNGSADFADRNNYDYDKSSNTYTLKSTVEAGQVTFMSIQKTKSSLIVKQTVNYGEAIDYCTWEYVDFDGNYNLKLPTNYRNS